MENTIEERATEYQNEKFSHFYGDLIPCYKEDYVKIANEQKSIDDEKYKRLRELAWDMYSKMMNLSTDLQPLRKSMEEFHHYICFEEENYEK